MTQCSEQQFQFSSGNSREVVAAFNGGTITSDGGSLLLQETDKKMKLVSRFSGCLLDGRDPSRVEHSVEQMMKQRIYGLAMGYEDLNDHELLRQDPLPWDDVWQGGTRQRFAGRQEHLEPAGTS